MRINTIKANPVKVEGERLEEVDSFIYLGDVIDKQGGRDVDIAARIGKARVAFNMLKNIWASKEIGTQTKLSIFNANIEPSIQFTVERETNRKISFLDVTVCRQDNGRLSTKVYRKPTHNERHLSFHSHHPVAHKRAVVNL